MLARASSTAADEKRAADGPLVRPGGEHVEQPARPLLVRPFARRRHEPGLDRDAGRGESVGAAQPVEQRGGQPRRLGLLVEPGEHERHPVAIPALVVDRHLGRGRRRLAACAADAHPVGADLLEVEGVEAGDDIRVGVRGRPDLVQQLRRHRVDRDRAAGVGVLGDHRRAVGVDLGDREAERRRQVGELREEGEVPSGRLGAALDDVSGGDGTGEAVPVRRRPIPPPRRRADDQRGVGHPRAHHDVSALGERTGDPPAAEVGVGGDRIGRQRRTGVDVGEVRPEVVDAIHEVVALDVGDGDDDAEAIRHLADPCRRTPPG